MQGSLDVSNANFESVSMQGSVGDLAIDNMLSTPKAGTTPKEGSEKPPADSAEDWLDAAPFLLADAFGTTNSLFTSKMRSGSMDGLLLSKEGLERANSQLPDMVGSLDLADVLGNVQPPAATSERTFSKELAALDLPTSLGGRQVSTGSAMAMSISGSTEANVHSFLQSVENATLPAKEDKGSVQSLLSREQPEASSSVAAAPRVAVFAAPAPVAAAHMQFTAVPGQQLPQPVANRASTHPVPSQPPAPAHSAPNKRPAPAEEETAVEPAQRPAPQPHLSEGSGAHVKHRPEMQRRARMGQEHWLSEVRQMRAVWEEREECRNNEAFRWQVETCAQLQIKSQHECILRALHLAAVDALITPLPFSQDTDNSFLGWTGFQVHQEHAQEFRRRVEQLFPTPLPENTLHTAFRRAGLVPDKWTSGWLGMSPFRFSLQTRQHYR